MKIIILIITIIFSISSIAKETAVEIQKDFFMELQMFQHLYSKNDFQIQKLSRKNLRKYTRDHEKKEI